MNNVKFHGSQTEQLLINSFACKAQTACRYTFFADIASKEGYEQIANIFTQTSRQELMHAKLFFNHLESASEGEINCTYSYLIGSTAENLSYAIKEEEYGCQEIYAKAEKTALSEGFDSIASTFKHVKNAEQHHAQRFKILYKNIIDNKVFEKDTPQQWICLKCGYVYTDNSAPNYCPNCYALKSYFEILCEKY